MSDWLDQTINSVDAIQLQAERLKLLEKWNADLKAERDQKHKALDMMKALADEYRDAICGFLGVKNGNHKITPHDTKILLEQHKMAQDKAFDKIKAERDHLELGLKLAKDQLLQRDSIALPAKDAEIEQLQSDLTRHKGMLEAAVEDNLRIRKHLWNLACEDWYWAKWPEEKDGKVIPGVIKDIQAIMAEAKEALKKNKEQSNDTEA